MSLALCQKAYWLTFFARWLLIARNCRTTRFWSSESPICIHRNSHLKELKTAPGRGVLLVTLGGGVPSGSHPISDQKMLSSTPVFRPGLWAEIMLSLLRLERKQKNSSNPFGICIFLFLSYSFGIETINTFIHSRSSLKNHTDSRPKWTKCIPVFRPNRRKNPTRWGGACLAYIRQYPGGWQIACGNSCIRQWRIETFR